MICYQQVATASETEWKTPAQSLCRDSSGEHTGSVKGRGLGSRLETCLPTWLSCSPFHRDSSHRQGNTRLSQERFFEPQLVFSSVSLAGDLPSLVKFLIFWCFCHDGPLKTSVKKWQRKIYCLGEFARGIYFEPVKWDQKAREVYSWTCKNKRSHWALTLEDAVVRGSLWSSSYLFDNEAHAISERDFAAGNCFCVFRANAMTDALCQRTKLSLPYVQWGIHSLRPKEQDSLMADHEGTCFRGRAASVIQGSTSLEIHPISLVDGTIVNKQEWACSTHWNVYS